MASNCLKEYNLQFPTARKRSLEINRLMICVAYRQRISNRRALWPSTILLTVESLSLRKKGSANETGRFIVRFLQISDPLIAKLKAVLQLDSFWSPYQYHFEEINTYFIMTKFFNCQLEALKLTNYSTLQKFSDDLELDSKIHSSSFFLMLDHHSHKKLNASQLANSSFPTSSTT